MTPPPILITGAAQRIGRYCAEQLQASGQPVIISYRQARPALDELRQQGITVLPADFSNEAGILAFIARLRQQTPQLRAIIHNASSWQPDSYEDATSQAKGMCEMFHVHMLAPYLINLQCKDLLHYGGPADIIHIGDDVTRKGSRKHAAYAATKAGLQNLTRSFAALLAPEIRVNALLPAMIQFNEGDPPEYRQQTLDKSVLGIEPGPEAVYQAICYLLEAHYVTGTQVRINGGRHLK